MFELNNKTFTYSFVGFSVASGFFGVFPLLFGMRPERVRSLSRKESAGEDVAMRRMDRSGSTVYLAYDTARVSRMTVIFT